MSKAFTREDDTPDDPPLRRRSPLPPGVRNLITPAGADRLARELKDLVEMDRPRLLADRQTSDSQFELKRIDQRIALLTEILETAVIVPRPPAHEHQVRFGAEVTVRNAADIVTYRIVGVDEADLDQDLISWRSPLAAALLNKRVGEQIKLRLPVGEQQLEILRIAYPEDSPG
jgi:transcription elongation factor GreB